MQRMVDEPMESGMYRICIWMNIPSHHQAAFFQALDDRDDVDLRVFYLNTMVESRIKEGWSLDHPEQPYESYVPGDTSPDLAIQALSDWQSRIHIINGSFCSALIDFFCRNGIAWCHWSEMPGIRLAEVLRYHMPLFRCLHPFLMLVKRKEGRKIRTHALGAFSQGMLARRAFRLMGVPALKMRDLFYVPAALQPMEPNEQVRQFAAGRKVFLATGTLCRRKGVDVLLKAFARLKSRDWCLVICGLDRAEGMYQSLSHELGLDAEVCFLGVHPSAKIASVYAAADVFVLASRFDGWGAVLNEAASLGLPLIATDLCGAAWHLIEPGRNGYRVRAGSVRALAHAMDNYVSCPALLKEHGEASKVLFRENFTPKINAGRLVNALQVWVPA